MSRLSIVPLPHPPLPPSNYLHTLALIHPEQHTIIQFFNPRSKSNLLQDVISQGIHTSSPSKSWGWVESLGEDYGQALGTMLFVPHSSPGEEVREIEAAKLELILRYVDLRY
ncbi:hypothetical protein M422DRAFT_277355 [Sphaerobolus stellatus SS14]|uniref:Uncharacterized protein n=1 Tax=Sphaerobolus stellatus (strain SS14) TaxID=990650 RepID=A0A0C9UAW2_SPHS4|nr:hypothetical protein M422DRAFT_277355 [Sphaerobolus stellatus SS14]